MEQPTTNTPQLTRHQRRQQAREQRKQGQVAGQRRGSAKKILTWVIVLVSLGGVGWGLVALSNAGSNSPTIAVGDQVAGDHVKGPENAKVTLIEYSDFQCPACGAYFPVLEDFLSKNSEQIKLIYRHLPLTTIHPNALVAARWAEAASLQNKFWEFHDKLFENQSAWSSLPNPTNKFEEYARELSLDVDKLKTDASSDAVKDAVDVHRNTASKANVTSTPSFYLNGSKMAAPSSFDDFTSKLQAAVDAAK